MIVLPEFATPVVLQTGTLTSGSPVVAGLTTTAALAGAVAVIGQGIPFDTFVQSIDSPTQLTLTRPMPITGPVELTFSIEAVSLAEAKKQLRLEIPDDDEFVVGLITAARMVVENQSRRALVKQERSLYFDGFAVVGGYYNRSNRQDYINSGGQWSSGLMPTNTREVAFPWPPLISVTAIEYYDANNILTVLPPEQYQVSPGNPGRVSCRPYQAWPQTYPCMDAIRIDFVCGYPAGQIPAVAKSAIKLVISDLYENRGSLGEKQVYKVPDTVCSLLDTLSIGTYS